MAIVRADGTRYAEGCVLWERERNGYDDSDFYAGYWDEESQTVKTVMFATTRGGCGDAWATKVDATDEVKAKAAAYESMLKNRREERSKALRGRANSWLSISLGLSMDQVQRLREAYPDTYKVVGVINEAISIPKDSYEFIACYKLLRTLKTNSFRSGFRESLAEQVLAWLNNPEPTHKTPLSSKQMSYAGREDDYIDYPYEVRYLAG